MFQQVLVPGEDGRILQAKGDWPRRGGRDFFELWVGYGLILAVIWTPRPWQRLLYWAPVLWIAGVSWLSFESWSAMGLRAGNFLRSLWVVGVAFVAATAAVLVAARLGTLHAPRTVPSFFAAYIGYAIWSFVQQLLLLDFFLFRLLRLMKERWQAVAVTAGIFALAHLPNPVLAPLTLVWGAAACLIFLRYRNVFPLALAHAVFGITVAITVPGHVSRNMRVGLGYLRYHRPHAGHRADYRSQTDQTLSAAAWVMAEAATRRS